LLCTEKGAKVRKQKTARPETARVVIQASGYHFRVRKIPTPGSTMGGKKKKNMHPRSKKWEEKGNFLNDIEDRRSVRPNLGPTGVVRRTTATFPDRGTKASFLRKGGGESGRGMAMGERKR